MWLPGLYVASPCYAFSVVSFREIAIDDRLPFSGNGQQLSVMAVLENGIVDVWPALLEKAVRTRKFSFGRFQCLLP